MSRNNQDLMVTCTRCTSSISIGQTTYDTTGRNLICFNCYNKIARGEEPEKIIQRAEPVDRVNYKCLRCSFSFSRNTNFQFMGICFNCGCHAVQRERSAEIVMKDRKSLLDY